MTSRRALRASRSRGVHSQRTANAMADKKAMNPAGLSDPIGAYSHAIDARQGRGVYVIVKGVALPELPIEVEAVIS